VVSKFGGALMEQETIDAMAQAAQESVRLDELESAASRVIAKVTGAEAGYVTSGASAALTLGIAACIAGYDVSRMNRLPDTSGMPNEVLIEYHQRCGYDRAVRITGARIVNVGMSNPPIRPGEIYITKARDFETAITDNTAAILYVYMKGNNPPLEEVINIGRRYHVPVFVNAAAQVPPVENLRRFISMGADLVAFSGGKGIRGPQASGILCGRRDLVASAALQHWPGSWPSFDMWDPPVPLIDKERLKDIPQYGIGRGMKASPEAIVGLLTALQRLTGEGFTKKAEQLRQLLKGIETCVQGIDGIRLEMSEHHGGYPILRVKVDESKLGRSATEVWQRLKDGDPPIYAIDRDLNNGVVTIHSTNLNQETARLVGKRLHDAITG